MSASQASSTATHLVHPLPTVQLSLATLPAPDPFDDLVETPRRRTTLHLRTQVEDKNTGGVLTQSTSSSTQRSQCAADDPVGSHSTSLAWRRDPALRQLRGTGRPETNMSRRDEAVREEQDSLLNNGESSATAYSRDSEDSVTTPSSTSLVLENLDQTPQPGKPSEPLEYRDDDSDLEAPLWKEDAMRSQTKNMSRRLVIIIWIVSVVALFGWMAALVSFLVNAKYQHTSTKPYDHEAPVQSAGKKVTLNAVMQGYFSPDYERLQWIDGANGEDGLLLAIGQTGQDFLVVEDVRSRQNLKEAYPSRTLMKEVYQQVNGRQVYAQEYWPSPDLNKVLILTEREKVFRHSYTGVYYIVDVQTQQVQPLDPANPEARVQLAQWSPTSDSIAFTRENNLYIRHLSSNEVRQVTRDGGPEYFYGIPDWTYEEEVLTTNIATWWARDGQYVAFMRTNETTVPEYPVQFYLNRPSTVVSSGMENYPDTTMIKYPKAGAPNPLVEMLFYDVSKDKIVEISIADGFQDDNRLIADVMWADSGRCLIRELNRVSDHIRMILIDVPNESSKLVRSENRKELDGGWVEPGHTTMYIPADVSNGRPQDGYVDVIIDGDNHHFGYFTPVDSATPTVLTSGPWDIELGELPAVDLAHNILYFIAAKEHPTTRYMYSVDLEGKEIKSVVPVDKPAYYGAEFSAKAGYAIVINAGPGIPSQVVMSLPSNPIQYHETLEENKMLTSKAVSHELPRVFWSNVTIDGVTLQVMERRPPHFNPNKKYPVLFQQYSGPGSQQVNRKFNIDFHSYVASSLEYIVVTVDGRGTGYIGRKAMCITRGQLGHYEAHDQIETAKIWAQKPYVDANYMAIWGWSYGGYTTLKTLEMDAGHTFKYGMAVAPVTDWRFYDSIYTERYMYKPQDNQAGYDQSMISSVYNISQNVRFLLMHGTGDDNVHVQNSLSLIDKLDLAGVTNYDVHFFPDSNHNINFHGANRVVYEKLEKWLVQAFNGAWYQYADPQPEGT